MRGRDLGMQARECGHAAGGQQAGDEEGGDTAGETVDGGGAAGAKGWGRHAAFTSTKEER